MKYKNGTKLTYVEGFSRRVSSGEVFEIIESPDYTGTYDIVGQPPAGWAPYFIEDPNYFEVVKEKNIDWQKELGGK